jgi:hypothetical protein
MNTPYCNATAGNQGYYRDPTDTSKPPELGTDAPGLTFVAGCFFVVFVISLLKKNVIMYGVTGVCLLCLLIATIQYMTGTSAINKVLKAGRPCKDMGGTILN